MASQDLDFTYGGAADRRKRIVGIVQERGFSTVAELSGALRVSEMTVRRDLRRLDDEGLLRSVHGGASAPITGPIGDFGLRSRRQIGVKLDVARRAAAMVEPNAVIALDAGTTLREVAAALPSELTATVVTHSLPVMAALANHKQIQLIGLGGLFHIETQAFAGPSALNELRQFRLQTVYLGASSIHDGALYCGNPLDAEMKAALIDRSDRVVLVSDASKFQITGLQPVAPLTSIHAIVVDQLEDADREMLAAADVEVIEVLTGGVPA